MDKAVKNITSVLISIIVLISYTEGQADSVSLPGEVDCTKICNGTKSIQCCNQTGPGKFKDKNNSSALAFTIAISIGSLATFISLLMCCWKFYKPCWNFYYQSERPSRGRMRTISAGVQTTSPSDAPPAYEWVNFGNDLAKISIPRCPSYVKDPPKYSESLFGDESDHKDTTIIEISMQESAHL